MSISTKTQSLKRNLKNHVRVGLDTHDNRLHEEQLRRVRFGNDDSKRPRLVGTVDTVDVLRHKCEVIIQTLMLDTERFIEAFRHGNYGVSASYCFDVRETANVMQEYVDKLNCKVNNV